MIQNNYMIYVYGRLEFIVSMRIMVVDDATKLDVRMHVLTENYG